MEPQTDNQRSQMWSEAGGVQNVAKEFCKIKNIPKKIPFNSTIWTKISQALFKTDNIKYRKWLSVIWHSNRRGLQQLVRNVSKAVVPDDDADDLSPQKGNVTQSPEPKV